MWFRYVSCQRFRNFFSLSSLILFFINIPKYLKNYWVIWKAISYFHYFFQRRFIHKLRVELALHWPLCLMVFRHLSTSFDKWYFHEPESRLILCLSHILIFFLLTCYEIRFEPRFKDTLCTFQGYNWNIQSRKKAYSTFLKMFQVKKTINFIYYLWFYSISSIELGV